MKKFKLEPVDTLVNVDRGNNPISVKKRWAMGSPYSHVFLYMGKLAYLRGLFPGPYLPSVPMLFESNGRGAVLRNLSNRYGQEVVVMRLRSEQDKERITYVLDEAIKLASDPQAYYDYLCIVRFILPRLIMEKLGLPVPLKWQRNPWHICSEAVFEVFYRAKLAKILPHNIVPLPGDFVTDSPLLWKAWSGTLSENIV